MLVKNLSDAAVSNKDKQLKVFFIFVSEDGKKLEPKLTALADKLKAHHICLTTLSSRDRGVSDYKVSLDPSVKSTIMLYRNRKVMAKEVNLLADDKGLAQLKSDIAVITK